MADDALIAELIRRTSAPGNINLFSRPTIVNPDGSISSVRSMGIGDENGIETLVPTVERHGKGGILSESEAIDQYRRTGEHLGHFKSIAESNAYAEKLHNDMADGWYTPPLASSRRSVDPNQLEKVLKFMLTR